MSDAASAGIYSLREGVLSRYKGTGSESTDKDEWLTNIHRDTAACVLGNVGQLLYYSVINNAPLEATRMTFLENMYDPCSISLNRQPLTSDAADVD